MKMLKHALVPTAMVAFALSACGGGPDINGIKSDFDKTPTGSTTDKQGVIAASGSGSMAASNGALSIAAGGVPGLSLTVEGRHFSRFAPVRVARSFQQNFSQKPGRLAAALRTSEDEALLDFPPGCVDNEQEVRDQYADLISSAISNPNDPIEIDLTIIVSDASKCGDAGVTGGYKLHLSGKSDPQNEDEGEFTLSASYTNLCEDGACIDGDIAIEFVSTAAKSTAFAAWDYKVTAKNSKGVQQELSSKGGFRAIEEGNSSSFTYLVYVKNTAGEEVFYKINASSGLSGGSLEIEGKDGKITCVSNANGSGSCTGNGTVEWTGDEYDAAIFGD